MKDLLELLAAIVYGEDTETETQHKEASNNDNDRD